MEFDVLARTVAPLTGPRTDPSPGLVAGRAEERAGVSERRERTTARGLAGTAGGGSGSSATQGVVVELSPRAEAAGRERPGELSRAEQEEVRELRARDREVRAHENAHKAAAGRHARGGPSYSYERGPDGRRYAVGGEVQIDTSAVPNDPDATILKMRQVRRAALAPAEPSPQDRKVASEASRTEAAARAEKLEVQAAERAEGQGASTEADPEAVAPASGPARQGPAAYRAEGAPRRGVAVDLTA